MIIKLKDDPYKERDLNTPPIPIIGWDREQGEDFWETSGSTETFRTDPLTWNSINYGERYD